MKKNDFILIIAILLVAGAAWLLTGAFSKEAEELTITVDGDLFGTYALSENQIIEIGDGNTCEIKDEEVTMIAADCPDQICMHHKPIHGDGETIICLPNKVTLTVHSAEEQPEVDTIVS